MGCGRILTIKDIQQLRDARRGMQAGAAAMAMGHVSLGLRMIGASGIQLQKVVGDVGERITQRLLAGEHAHNLNVTVEHNSKVYDIGSQDRVASVKTYGVGHGGLSRSTVSNYVRDLRVATGRSSREEDARKLEAAAQSLRQAASRIEVSLPSALRAAQSDKAACDWLRQHAEMRIPDDQVAPVRTAVKSSVIRDPEAYGLSANASYGERATLAQQLAQRVQPMGMSVSEIERTLENHL